MPPGDFNRNKTHCKKGHEFSKENTLFTVCSRGMPRRNCKACQHLTAIKSKYGIEMIVYDAMFKLQNGQCGICSKPHTDNRRRMAVDHCHKTGNVRGLLCVNCNTGLGKFNDGELFASAVNYLSNSKA